MQWTAGPSGIPAIGSSTRSPTSSTRSPPVQDTRQSPSSIREALDLTGPLPEQGTESGASSPTAPQLFDHSLFNGHPRFFGYITAPPAPIGILADFLAAAVNPNVGAWTLSPGRHRDRDRKRCDGSPRSSATRSICGGLLVSGGNMANFVCFLAARAAKAGWDVREHGVAGSAGERLRVYASAETHTWIQKAADLAGLGTASIRWIPTDATLRMDVAALRRQIEADAAAGDVPCMSSAPPGRSARAPSIRCRRFARSAGSTGSGFTWTARTAASRRRFPRRPMICAALSLADSVAVDPHKWLYAPLEAGCALVRDPEALRAAFAYHPPYYHFEERATNYVDYGPQNSRGFRALKVWLALRHVGAAGYRRMIADDILDRKIST